MGKTLPIIMAVNLVVPTNKAMAEKIPENIKDINKPIIRNESL